MKVLELFAGTRSIGKAFEARGHQVFSVEWDKSFDRIDLYADIGQLTAAEILEKFGRPDVIWASPDCATFSIAAISRHRRKNQETGELEPVSEYAKFCDQVDQHVLELISELQPAVYFIENPRDGCWFCPCQGVEQLRRLYNEFPEYWQLMMDWDKDTAKRFKIDNTLKEYDLRFRLENEGTVPIGRGFRWSMLNQEKGGRTP